MDPSGSVLVGGVEEQVAPVQVFVKLATGGVLGTSKPAGLVERVACPPVLAVDAGSADRGGRAGGESGRGVPGAAHEVAVRTGGVEGVVDHEHGSDAVPGDTAGAVGAAEAFAPTTRLSEENPRQCSWLEPVLVK